MNPETPFGQMAFRTARWSVVLAASGDGTEARRALGELCRLYWPPAYVWLRRRGLGRAEAENFARDFFARLLANEGPAVPRPEAGRFRSFLLRCLANFPPDAPRRSGDQAPLALDTLDEFEHEMHSPAIPSAPAAAFNRRWAEVIVAQADAAVKREYDGPRAAIFERLRPLVFGARETQEFVRASAALTLRENALRTEFSRLRSRFREAIRAEVAQTLSDPADLRDELSRLLSELAQPAETTGAAPPT